jgi:hypothetical protein
MRQYFPRSIATLKDVAEALDYMQDELNKISAAINDNVNVQLEILHVAPTKIQNGMIRYADGSSWNPGSGEGIYIYERNAWRKIAVTP